MLFKIVKINNIQLRCKWPNRTECSYKDFDQQITDFGICYALKLTVPGGYLSAEGSKKLNKQ